MSDARITVKRSETVLPVSRELLIEHGVVEPTPAERAELDRAAVETRRRADARARTLQKARYRLVAITDPLARTVLDLHAEARDGTCRGDDIDGHDAEPPDWPCRTVEHVATHYGIPLETP